MPSQQIPIPIPLASLKARSSRASDERLINGYVEQVGSGADARAVVYGSAGLTVISSDPADPCRGAIEVDGARYSINGSGVYKTTLSGAVYTTLQVGVVPGSLPVKMARNAAAIPMVAIVAEGGLYLLQNDIVTTVFEPDLPANPIDVTWCDGYFLFPLADGRFFISGINDITVNALDFATAEADPDGLVAVARLRREVYFFGSKTIQPYTNTGNADFPFEPLGGAVLPYGCASKHSIQELNNALYWLDTDGIVQRTTGGYSVQAISVPGLYKAVSAVADKTEIRSFAYKLGTHSYYVLTHSTFTWVYDASNELWHERQSYGLDSWQAVGHAFAFGKNTVGSTISGKIFAIDEMAYDEDDQEIITKLRFPRVEDFPNGAAVPMLDVDIEPGVGRDVGATSADTIDPKATLGWSDDGAKTWKGGRTYPLGKKGEYRRRLRATRLGSFGSAGRVWELSISSRVFKCIIGATMHAEQLKV